MVSKIFQLSYLAEVFHLATDGRVPTHFLTQVHQKSQKHYPNSCCHMEKKETRIRQLCNRRIWPSQSSTNVCISHFTCSDPIGFRVVASVHKFNEEFPYCDPGCAYVINLSSFSLSNLISWTKKIPL